jgi:3-hydroxyacyl-[acyl-carrier-protein] dehydratase
MKNTSDSCMAADQPFQHSVDSTAVETGDPLREILKRCPPATYEAARQFRLSGDTRHIPIIILGIIERFVESGLRGKLKEPHDSLLLAEDLGLDSLTMMEIVILVEDVLGLSIKNEELRDLRTLGDVRQFIANKLGQPGLKKHAD